MAVTDGQLTLILHFMTRNASTEGYYQCGMLTTVKQLFLVKVANCFPPGEFAPLKKWTRNCRRHSHTWLLCVSDCMCVYGASYMNVMD